MLLRVRIIPSQEYSSSGRAAPFGQPNVVARFAATVKLAIAYLYTHCRANKRAILALGYSASVAVVYMINFAWMHTPPQSQSVMAFNQVF